MDMIENALTISKAQAKAANEAAQAVSACFGAVLDASAAFARSSAERNAELAATLMGARTLEAAADIHGAFVRDSMRASVAMAVKIADACTTAAKRCNDVAAEAMRGADRPA